MTLPEVRQHLARPNLQKAAETMLATQVEALAECASAAGANGGEVWTGKTVNPDWLALSGITWTRKGRGWHAPQPVLASLVGAWGPRIAESVGAVVADAIRGV